MHVMEYPPGGRMRPDIIRPTGVNPVGKMEKGRAGSAPFLFLVEVWT